MAIPMAPHAAKFLPTAVRLSFGRCHISATISYTRYLSKPSYSSYSTQTLNFSPQGPHTRFSRLANPSSTRHYHFVRPFSSSPHHLSDSSSSTLPPPPDHLNEAESHIYQKLAAALAPTKLEVQDISGGCGSMYGIEVQSERFRGLSMLKQQRLVNEVLGEEIKAWHGIQLRTTVP